MNKEFEEHRIAEIIYNLKHVTANTVIHKGPCIVGNVVCSGEGADATCDVYDGDNTSAEKKLHLDALSKTSFGTGAANRGYFRNGIYIVVNASTTHVSIWYIPLSSADVRHIQTHH